MRRLSIAVVAAAAIVLGVLLFIRRTPPARDGAVASSRPEVPSPAPPGGGRPAPPPSFKTSPAGDDIETDPRTDRYNPLVIAKVIGMKRLFDQEPRDEQWAPEMERRLGPPLVSDVKFVGRTKEAEIECRTSTCEIRWEGDGKAADRIMAMLTMVYMGAAISRTGRGSAVVTFWGAPPQSRFNARRPAEELASMIITNRRPMLEHLRSGEGRPTFYRVLQPSDWPDGNL